MRRKFPIQADSEYPPRHIGEAGILRETNKNLYSPPLNAV